MPTKNDPILDEMQTIRKLLMVALIRGGMTQEQIGAVLGVHRTQIGRMFPPGSLASAGQATKARSTKRTNKDSIEGDMDNA